MHLTLIGQRGPSDTSLHVAGDTLTIDGVAHDLSAVPEGGEGWLDGHLHIISPITRQGGVLRVTLRVQLDHSADLREVAQWVIEDATGDVTIPATRKPAEEQAE